MRHQGEMDEKQVRRSDRKQILSEKALNSECNIIKNIIKPNSAPELSGTKPDTAKPNDIPNTNC